MNIGTASTIRIEPGLSAQIQPGGSVVYQHIVNNDGNAAIHDIELAISHSLTGWTAAVYADTAARTGSVRLPRSRRSHWNESGSPRR